MARKKRAAAKKANGGWGGGEVYRAKALIRPGTGKFGRNHSCVVQQLEADLAGTVLATAGCGDDGYVGNGPDELLPIAKYLAGVCGHDAVFTKKKS